MPIPPRPRCACVNYRADTALQWLRTMKTRVARALRWPGSGKYAPNMAETSSLGPDRANSTTYFRFCNLQSPAWAPPAIATNTSKLSTCGNVMHKTGSKLYTLQKRKYVAKLSRQAPGGALFAYDIGRARRGIQATGGSAPSSAAAAVSARPKSRSDSETDISSKPHTSMSSEMATTPPRMTGARWA